jgi:dUTP pyrophosphatase
MAKDNKKTFKYYKHGEVKSPSRGTKNSSGIDFYSPTDITIPANSDVLIDSLLSIEIPHGYDLVFHDKSGVATKKKLTTLAKVVDSDYRYPNKVHFHLWNLSNQPVEIKAGDKIIQGIIRKTELWAIEEDTTMAAKKYHSERTGGFGSTNETKTPQMQTVN